MRLGGDQRFGPPDKPRLALQKAIGSMGANLP
jgi:hypothetical protein